MGIGSEPRGVFLSMSDPKEGVSMEKRRFGVLAVFLVAALSNGRSAANKIATLLICNR
jgi:hypothetical protein